MGVDVNYFIDHDLPTDSEELFTQEFKKRTQGDDSWETVLNDSSNLRDGIWILFSNNEVQFSFELFKNTVMVNKFIINGKEAIDNYRWYTVRVFLLTDSEPG
ncbi:MAG: hypothetical protein K5751_08485 [Treponemataceae bacterium]|nr:hypothetical protein [Treponemataceae bacterium]